MVCGETVRVLEDVNPIFFCSLIYSSLPLNPSLYKTGQIIGEISKVLAPLAVLVALIQHTHTHTEQCKRLRNHITQENIDSDVLKDLLFSTFVFIH